MSENNSSLVRLIFEKEADARAKLEELYLILVKMERFASGSKRTRVIVIIQDEDAKGPQRQPQRG
jgi:hypothetical protein